MQSMLKIVGLVNSAIASPFADETNRLLKVGKVKEASQRTVNPLDYGNDYVSYLKDAQSAALLKKLGGLETGVDLEGEAKKTFFECEAQCKLTNDRLAEYVGWFEQGFHGDEVDLRLYEYISGVRGIVRRTLGRIPNDLVPRFGNGATFFDKGDKIILPHKIGSRPSRTPDAEFLDYLQNRTLWARCSHGSSQVVKGNRFTSVPKDSFKNRGICVEPSLNLGYQLAVGAHLKMRLRDYADLVITPGNTDSPLTGLLGILQQEGGKEIHGRLARFASETGTLCTIDLSNASDTVAYMLVKLFLPKEWFDLLASLRSPYTRVDNKWVKLHKFSSMGNGYTFELETLIFYSMTRAVQPEGIVKTYGDDIICETRHFEDVCSALKLFGFTPNAKKSYGPGTTFRESCGSDYLDGALVRPIFLKKMPEDPSQWIEMANRISSIADLLAGLDTDAKLLKKAWFVALDQIPSSVRQLRGPRSLGDCVIHDDRGWITRSQGEISEILAYLPVGKPQPLESFPTRVHLASLLLGYPSLGASPRNGISGYQKKWISLIERAVDPTIL